MSFPTNSTIIDNFNRTENPISDGGKWTTPIESGSDILAADGTHAYATVANSAGAFNNGGYRNDQNYGPDVEVYVTQVTAPDEGGGSCKLYARLVNIGTGTIDGYCLDAPRTRSGTDEWRFKRIDNSVETQIGSSIFQEVAAGDSVGVSIVGNTLEAWYKSGAGAWTSLGTTTDSTYSAAGKIGLALAYQTTLSAYDNFGGGTFVPGGGSPGGGGSPAADTFYVKKSGVDGAGHTGSSADPWLTFNYALTRIAGGDTLYFYDGDYDEGLVNAIPSGTNGNPTLLSAYPGQTAVWLKPLVADVGNNGYVLYFSSAVAYITLDGINIDATHMTHTAVRLGPDDTSTHITLQNLDVLQGAIGGSAAVLVGSHDNSFINLVVHGGGTSGGCGSLCASYAFYLAGNRNLIDGCECYDTSTFFIQIYSSTLIPTGNIVRNTYCHDLTRSGYPGSGAGMLIAGNDNQIYNNIIDTVNVSGNGDGLSCYSGNGNLLYNNTIYACPGYAFKIDSGCSNTEIKNNIAYACGAFSNLGGLGTTYLTNIENTTPLFIDAPNHNFRVSAGSAALDTGTTLSSVATDKDGISRPQGGAYDIGAYEGSSPPIAALSPAVANWVVPAVGFTTVTALSPVTAQWVVPDIVVTNIGGSVSGPTAPLMQNRAGIGRANAIRSNYFWYNGVTTIAGTAMSDHTIMASVKVHLGRNTDPSTAALTLEPGATIPTAGQAIVISLGSASNAIFAGQIATVTHRRLKATDSPFLELTCVDGTRLLNRRLVTYEYVGLSATAIAIDLLTTWASNVTATHVVANLPTIANFPLVNKTVGDALTDLVHLLGGEAGWYVTKTYGLTTYDVHVFGPDGEMGNDAPQRPQPLREGLVTLMNNTITHTYDVTQFRSRDYVETGSTANLLIDVPAGSTQVPVSDTFPMAGAGGTARINTQRITFTDASDPGGIGPNGPTADTAADILAGDTSFDIVLDIDGTNLLANIDSTWYAAGNQVFHATTISGATLSGIPASGYGAILENISAGTAVTGVPLLSGVTGILVDQHRGAAVVPYGLVNNTSAQTAMAAIEGGDGIHEYLVDANMFPTVGSATPIGQADLNAFATPLLTASWVTHDVTAIAGVKQYLNLGAPDPVAAWITIENVDIDGFDVPRYAPRRTCRGSLVKREGLLEALTLRSE